MIGALAGRLRRPGRVELFGLAALLLATRLLPKPAPAEVYGIAMVSGALLVLQSVGVVLVYRSNRVINFAQPAFAGAAAMLFTTMAQYRSLLLPLGPLCGNGCTQIGALVQLNYWLSLALVLGVVAGLGRLTHLLVVRRFAATSPLLLTVATIFVGFTVLGLAAQVAQMLIPQDIRDSGLPLKYQPPSLPFDVSLRAGLVTFHAADLLAVAVAAAAVATLTLHLRRSATGKAIRAAADNAERAATLGVNVDAVAARVWTISAALAGVAGVLGAMTSGVSGGDAAADVRILAVAVIARMVSLPLAAIGAVTIALLAAATQWSLGSTVILDATLFLIIGGLLLLQSTRMSRAEHAQEAEWRPVPEARPIPRALRRLPEVRRWVVIGVGAVAAVLVVFPWLAPASQSNLASGVLLYAMIGLSLLVLTGWAGQISLGQVAFAAVGAYVVAVSGLPFPLSLMLGALAGGLAALLVGIPALRLRGLHLAVMTLAFHQAVLSVGLSPSYLGRFLPTEVARPHIGGLDFGDERAFYYLALVVLALVVAAVVGMRRSRTARALIACRDNQQAAQSFGINLVRTKVGAFVVSGVIAGLAGGLMAYHQQAVEPVAFNLALSRTIFLYAVVGGMGMVAGPLLGFVYFLLPQLFQLPGLLPLLLVGPGGLVLLLLVPGGLAQLTLSARDAWLRNLARRHRIPAPALLADTAAAADKRPALAPKVRAGGASAFVPRRYHPQGQWLVDGVDAMHQPGSLT